MIVNLDFFGPKARFHHIGMAVRSIEGAVPGLDVVEDPTQRVRVAFIQVAGMTIELIEPASKNSPIDGSLEKGRKLLHFCVEVPSLDGALKHCAPYGFRKMSQATPAAAFEMRKIIWVYSIDFGLVELVEAKNMD